MFDFLNFRWFLLLIYRLLKISGFFFVTISIPTLESLSMSRKYLDYLWFAISLGFSFYSLSYDGYVEVAKVTHSKIMEIGVNTVTRIVLVTSVVLKITSMVYGKKFYEILSNLTWCHLKVCLVFIFWEYFRINIFFFS